MFNFGLFTVVSTLLKESAILALISKIPFTLLLRTIPLASAKVTLGEIELISMTGPSTS